MAIKIEIKTNGFEIRDRLYDYVSKKAEKLERYVNDLEEARIELTHAKSARMASDAHSRMLSQLILFCLPDYPQWKKNDPPGGRTFG